MDEKTKKELEELGIGVASVAIVGVLAATIRKMQKEGKLNKKEGERMLHQAIAGIRSVSTKYAKVANADMDRVVKAGTKASPFATKKEIAQLNAKIDKLTKLQKAKKRR